MAFKRSSNSAGGLQAAFDSGTPAQKAAFQSSVLADPTGVFAPSAKLPLPAVGYRAVGSLASPLATLSGSLTSAQPFTLPTELRVPVASITPGCRVSGRAVFGRTGSTTSWATVRFGSSGGIADATVTSVEITTTGCVVYFDLDIGPAFATTAASHRYLHGAGDSFTLTELAMAPPADDWFVSFSATSSAADTGSSTSLLGYDVVVYP